MDACHLYKLPNELLLQILVPIPSPLLLPLTVLSHRIYTIVLRILHSRLVAASELHSHSLLLECYHPSAKLTEPPYFCTYKGTDGLTQYESPTEDGAHIASKLGEMRNLYSRFRPHHRELEPGGRRVRGPPGDIPGSRTFPGTASDRHVGETVKQTLTLEGHERFTQLVAQTNLVKLGPRNGLYQSFQEVSEGVLRVFKDWLKDMSSKDGIVDGEDVVEEIGRGNDIVKEASGEERSVDDGKILWLCDKTKNAGFRFNVRERKLIRDAPVLLRVDEDTPVTFEVEFDELLIRTSHLVLMLEKSLMQEDNSSGKAVVFGSFG